MFLKLFGNLCLMFFIKFFFCIMSEFFFWSGGNGIENVVDNLIVFFLNSSIILFSKVFLFNWLLLMS